MEERRVQGRQKSRAGKTQRGDEAARTSSLAGPVHPFLDWPGRVKERNAGSAKEFFSIERIYSQRGESLSFLDTNDIKKRRSSDLAGGKKRE